MADIRISKLLRQFNIGLDDLVSFLQGQGVEVDANPNAKVSDEYLPVLNKQFGKDLELKQAADKVEVKITEILEKSGRRASRDQADEEEEPEQETIIKSNTFINAKKEISAPEPEPEPVVVEPEPEPEPVAVAPEPEAASQLRTASDSSGDVSPEPPVSQSSETSPEPEPEPVVEEPEPEEEPEPAAEPEAEPEAPAQPAAGPAGPELKVVGKIDLSQFDRKPKKRERISKGTQKVDVAKAGAGIEKNPKKENRPQQNQQQAAGKGRKRDRDRFKPALTEAQQEELQKEIQKQVKETYAKMNEGKKNNFGAKYRKEKREA
ncbi:MAG: hypothetical protein J6Y27_07010, partial [Bacteroidales bacterium]|nr:hypothetical protein [Bacteroidales bacterium]